MITKDGFLAFYPQFSAVPTLVIEEYVTQANARFGDFDDDADEARRLYVAHKLTLYAFTYSSASPSIEALATLGRAQLSQQISSMKVGEAQISYSNSTAMSSSASTELADLSETAYGISLLTLLRIHSRSIYVP